MNTILIAALCISLSSVCFCTYSTSNNNYYGSTYQRAAQNTDNNLEWSGYTYSIDEGQCDGTKLVDEDVKKEADPYTYKKTTYTWTGRGMFYLTCVRVLNRMARDQNAAEARISDGGVGEGQVRIEMRSKNSQRLHFHVEIWGKETRAQASNMAVMLNTPSSVLYMNGKKYCECT